METPLLLSERSYKGKNMVKQDKAQVQTLAGQLANCVNLGSLLNFSETKLPYLPIDGKNDFH